MLNDIEGNRLSDYVSDTLPSERLLLYKHQPNRREKYG